MNDIKQPIFESVSSLTELMQKTPDLQGDVLPFLNGTFAKIKQLTMHNVPFEVSYELMQIATNYLPKTVHAYCALPIEYRNKKEIKGTKTARDLLIGDLTLIKKQVYELESTIFSDLERNIRINSNVIKEKFEGQMQLATEGETGFINQFNVDKYTTSAHYLDNMFTKVPQEPTPTQKTVNVLAKTGSVAGKVALSGFSIVKNMAHTLLSPLGRILFSFYKMIKNNIGMILGIGFIVILMGGFISLMAYDHPEVVYHRAAKNHLSTSYQVMQATQLTSEQLAGFSKEDYAQFAKDAQLAQTKATYKVNDNNLNVVLEGYDQNHCKEMVDHHSNSLPETQMKINTINLPEKTVYSNNNYFINNNHNLCYLKENNSIEVNFNSKGIYEDGQLQNKKDSAWINKQLSIAKQTKDQIKNVRSSGKHVNNYDYLIDQVEQKEKVYQGLLQSAQK